MSGNIVVELLLFTLRVESYVRVGMDNYNYEYFRREEESLYIRVKGLSPM